MAKATDFKTTDKTTNSLFKGAGFNKSKPANQPDNQQQMPTGKPAINQNKPIQQQVAGIRFEDLSDDEKNAFAFAAQRYNYQGKATPEQWAEYIAYKYNMLDYQTLVKAATELKKNGNGVPWWSAARDWNIDALDQIFTGNSFKPSQAIIEGVSHRF